MGKASKTMIENAIAKIITAILAAIISVLLAHPSKAGEIRQEFRDSNGHFVGTAITRDGRTEYRDRYGHFQGSSTQTRR